MKRNLVVQALGAQESLRISQMLWQSAAVRLWCGVSGVNTKFRMRGLVKSQQFVVPTDKQGRFLCALIAAVIPRPPVMMPQVREKEKSFMLR